MPIPQSQLETWSRQGATTTSASTYQAIRGVLERGSAARKGTLDIYLQGSYANHTNIRGNSDVDIICELTTTYSSERSQLSTPEQARFDNEWVSANYTYEEFRQDVLADLRRSYSVTEGNKSLKVAGGQSRLPADVVACISHRRYVSYPNAVAAQFHNGIRFEAQHAGLEIINYPKQHRTNATWKHQATGELFKPIVRIFKNARTYMIDRGAISSDLAPSYFVECLLYNVPNPEFRGTYATILPAVLNWLCSGDHSRFTTASGLHWLFGASDVTWTEQQATEFRAALIALWNDWQ